MPENSAKTTKERRERRICRIATPHRLAKFCSSLLVPSMIAVFTIVTTVLQMNLAKQQREQDLIIANQTRILQNEIEENRRVAEANAQTDQQMNTVLAIYLKDMAELMLSRNFTLEDPMTATVVRAQTLTTLGQLDSKRKDHLVQFLYDAQLMSGKQPSIDLTDADLGGVDFSNYALAHISFAKCVLVGATFRGSSLQNVTFANAQLSGVSFDKSDLKNVSFSKADLSNTSFIDAKLSAVDFDRSKLTEANFTLSTFTNITFAKIQLRGVSFDNCQLNDARFHDASLSDSSFTAARFSEVDVSDVIITNTDFTSLDASSSRWWDIKGDNIIFDRADVRQARFIRSTLINTSFVKATLDGADMHNITLVKTNFITADLNTVNFANSNLSGSIFNRSKATSVSFYCCILTDTTWIDANVRNADFSQSNLSGASITDAQMQRAWKTFDIILPNGKKGIDRNLLENGGAENESDLCQTNPWHVTSMIAEKYKEPTRYIFGQCHFTREFNSTEGRMWQRVRVPSQYDEWIRTNMALIWITGQCVCNDQLVLHLRQFNGGSNASLVNNIHGNGVCSSNNDVLFLVHLATTEVELEIVFTGTCATNNCGSCDNLKLAIWHRNYTLEQ